MARRAYVRSPPRYTPVAMTLRELLTRHELTAYVDAFERERLAPADLAALTDDDLRVTLGMNALMDRKRFRAMVASLEAPAGPVPSIDESGVTRLHVAPLIDSGATRLADPNALPKQLGSYRVLGLVGAGGMGIVVRARHMEESWAEQQGGDVAIKLIHPHIAAADDFRARFVREAALGRKVQHPGLAPTWDVVLDGGWLGTVMALVSGQPLSELIRPGGLPLEEAIRLLTAIGEVLDYLHSQGIVHRDVKPANIVVRSDGRPILLDLGIAKDTGSTEERTRAMTAMGTSAWMAPEQADAKHVDGAADRYALGLVAYALLAGRMPWAADVSELRMISMKLTNQLEPISTVRAGLPPQVVAAVTKMLSVTPAERYATSASFVASLGSTYVVEARVGGFLGFGSRVARAEFSMVQVRPCAFTMGSPPSEQGRSEDEAEREVRITQPYAISTTPVTQHLYQTVLGERPSRFGEQRPVLQVSWFDSVRFCNALSARLGLRDAYVISSGELPDVVLVPETNGFRLPTEAEWECAARGGERHVFAGSDVLSQVGWYDADGRHGARPVAQKRPNALGLYDMSGNVWEWCQDWHVDVPHGAVEDPLGPATGAHRVVRGGSWDGGLRYARVAHRGRLEPIERGDSIGFRIVRGLG